MTDERIDKQLEKKNRITNYKDIPEYKDKGKFNIDSAFLKFFSFLIILSFVLMIIIFNATQFSDGNGEYKAYTIVVTIALFALLAFVIRALYRKVFIDKYGVKLINNGLNTKRFFSWDEIKAIGIGISPFGARPTSGFLFFTTKDIKDDLVIPLYLEGSDIIVVTYRPKITHCILKYWDGEIKNLDTQKSWIKYINKL